MPPTSGTNDDSALPDLAEAIASLLPGGAILGVGFNRITRAMLDEKRRRESAAIAAAEIISGLDRFELAERVADTPELVPLAARTLFLAGMTSQDQALTALGATLGAAIIAPSEQEKAELIVEAVQGLTPTHVRILQTLNGRAVHADGTPSAWHLQSLADAMNLPIGDFEAHLASCTSRGFVRLLSLYGGPMGYELTQLGRDTLETLRAFEDARAQQA